MTRKKALHVWRYFAGAYFFYFFVMSAIPTHRRLPEKDLQTEAKAALHALYSGEKAFYAEVGRFSGDLQQQGYYHPEGEGLRYVVGFSEKCRLGSEKVHTLELPANDQKFKFAFSTSVRDKILKAFAEIPCHPRFPEHWEAYAVGDIGGDNLDIWKMTDEKKLSHIQVSIPEKSRPTPFTMIMVLGFVVLLISYIGIRVLLGAGSKIEPRASQDIKVR